MDWQMILVVLIVAASAVYLARSFWRMIKGGGCTHGCLPHSDPCPPCGLSRWFGRRKKKSDSP